MLLVLKKGSLDEFHSDRVKSRDDDFSECCLSVNCELINSFRPVDPLFLFDNKLIVVAGTALWKFKLVIFAHGFLELAVELSATIKSRGTAKGPNHAENEDTFKHAL